MEMYCGEKTLSGVVVCWYTESSWREGPEVGVPKEALSQPTNRQDLADPTFREVLFLPAHNTY